MSIQRLGMNVHSGLICNSQNLEPTQLSINRLMDKINLVCPYNEGISYPAVKTNEQLIHIPACLNLKGVLLSERTQA